MLITTPTEIEMIKLIHPTLYSALEKWQKSHFAWLDLY